MLFLFDYSMGNLSVCTVPKNWDFFLRKLLIFQILAAKMAEVFKKRVMASYARHVTQNDFFLSNYIRLPNIFPTIYGLLGSFAAVRPQKKINRVYVVGNFPVDANVIEHWAETWPTSKIVISSASQNKFGRSMITRWVIYRSVLWQKIGIFFFENY